MAPEISAVEQLHAPIWPKDFGLPLDMMSGDWSPACWQSSFARATFGEVHKAKLPNPQSVDREGLVAFFGSMARMHACDARRRPPRGLAVGPVRGEGRILDDVREYIPSPGGLLGSAKGGPRFTISCVVVPASPMARSCHAM